MTFIDTHAEDFLHVARLVARGEWTSYGDISAAVLGHKRAARIVGFLAARDHRFPNAHRVLTAAGTVARSDGAGVLRRRLLEDEGVSFARGRADPARRIHWDELRRRDGRVARTTRG